MIRFKFSRPFKKYLVIGILVFAFEIGVIVIAGALGASNVIAVSYSFILGLILSFILQKFITFGDKRTHYRILLPQAVAFSLLVLFNFIFTISVTQLTTDILPATISRTIALGITTIWNFYLYRTRIFSDKKASDNGE